MYRGTKYLLNCNCKCNLHRITSVLCDWPVIEFTDFLANDSVPLHLALAIKVYADIRGCSLKNNTTVQTSIHAFLLRFETGEFRTILKLHCTIPVSR